MAESGGGGFGGALASGAGGALGGGLVGAGINLLGNIFGLNKGPKEDPVTAQSRRLALQAQQQNMAFANSVPGSDPSELASLSQERGALGAAQRQQTQGLMGAYNPQMGNNGLADLLKNLSNSQVGQQMSLQESHLQNALFARRQALSEAANSGGRVAGPTYQPQSDLPQMLAKVAHSIAYQQGVNGADETTPGDVPYAGQNLPGTAPLSPAGPPVPPGLPAGVPYPDVPTQSAPQLNTPAMTIPSYDPSTSGLGSQIGKSFSPWLKLGDDPAFNAQAQAMSRPQLSGPGSQPQNAMNQWNMSGMAAIQNQARQAGSLTGPAAQRFLVAPNGVRLPY